MGEITLAEWRAQLQAWDQRMAGNLAWMGAMTADVRAGRGFDPQERLCCLLAGFQVEQEFARLRREMPAWAEAALAAEQWRA